MNNIIIPIEEYIKKVVEEKINEEIDSLIEDRVKKFHTTLVNRKDDYISEIMKGIRISHEQIPGMMGINYRIIFENIYNLKGE